MNMPLPTSATRPALLEFAVSHYAQIDVERACLALQDRKGANVNLLLWALWRDEIAPFDGAINRRAWLSAAQRRIGWQQRCWVGPLRELRRALPKGGRLAGVRQRLKSLELKGEFWQLAQLENLSRPPVLAADQTAEGDSRETLLNLYLRQQGLCDTETEAYRSRLYEGLANTKTPA